MLYKLQTMLAVVKLETISHNSFLDGPHQLPELSQGPNSRGDSSNLSNPRKFSFSPPLSEPQDTPTVSDSTAHSWEQGSSLPAWAGKQEAAPTLPRGGADKFPFLGGHLSRPSTLWMQVKHWPQALSTRLHPAPHPGLLHTLSQGSGSAPMDGERKPTFISASQAKNPFTTQVGLGICFHGHSPTLPEVQQHPFLSPMSLVPGPHSTHRSIWKLFKRAVKCSEEMHVLIPQCESPL